MNLLIADLSHVLYFYCVFFYLFRRLQLTLEEARKATSAAK